MISACKNKNCYSLLLFIVLLVSSHGVTADAGEPEEVKVYLRMAPKAYHLSDKGDPNERNQILAVEYGRWGLATFINSQSDRSWAVGYQFLKRENPLTEHWRWNFSIPVGVAYGYTSDKVDDVEGFTPFVFVNLGIGYHFSERWDLGLNVNYIPTGNGGVLVPELKIGFPL